MTGFVIGSAYGVSTGLLLYGMAEGIIAPEHRFVYLIAWAAAGLVMALVAVFRGKKED
jgi:hypothetical protein